MPIIKINNLNKIKQDKIIKIIEDKGYIIIRGLFQRKLIRTNLNKLKKKNIYR